MRSKKIFFLLLFFIAFIMASAWFLFFSPYSGKFRGTQKIQIQPEKEEISDSITPPTDVSSPENNLPSPPPVSQNTTPDTAKNNSPDPKTEKISAPLNINIIQKLVSWGYQKAQNRQIDTIIIHSSYNALTSEPYSVDELIKEYKQYGVSPHYLIDRTGKIYQLVSDNNIAYHAGVSQMPDGRKNVNNFSLGIELMNTKSDKYTDAQYQTLNNLISALKKKYSIKYVLGHNQIASDRKTDPWNFDWKKLK